MLNVIWVFAETHLDAVATFVVGFFAIYLYWKQKQDKKKNAASLILQEIRYAEQNMRIARDRSWVYSLSLALLPTNSWHENIHLFVNDLDGPELDQISRFYIQAHYIDSLVATISGLKADLVQTQVKRSISPPSSSQPKVHQQQAQSQSQPEQVTVTEEVKIDYHAESILKVVSEKVEFIYNTPAIDKIRKIAGKKNLLIRLFNILK